MEEEQPPPSALVLANGNTAQGRAALEQLAETSMRCGGCGAKVGATVLSRVMARLDFPTRPEVLVGLDAPDDCAVVSISPGAAIVHTVDFFRSFIKVERCGGGTVLRWNGVAVERCCGVTV
jgi:selenide,water dikinase